ncbi:hypothetical protein N7456_002659 [Penicillium angulare]|uniref:Uncharacterized protein n=1 Tax=Penicillium angulare TaxID=116970 RepID=A0A9W9G9M8_9EURO|nr:hypothetical protein N7456_002659 [Penicillium angulare]
MYVSILSCVKRVEAIHLKETTADINLALKEPAREWIAEQETQFGGALAYNKQGKLYREPDLSGEEWVGPPTPKMDALWDHVEAGEITEVDRFTRRIHDSR